MRQRLNFYCFLGLFAGLITPMAWRPYVLMWAILAIVWWGSVLFRRTFVRYLAMPVVLALVLPACAASDKATVYTEEGLRAAEQGWDGSYNVEADRCGGLHEPKTPGMEECFGKTYDADAAVATVVQSAVALLRGYWIARAAGENPDFARIMSEVQAMIDDLPPEAREFFDRVKGLP